MATTQDPFFEAPPGEADPFFETPAAAGPAAPQGTLADSVGGFGHGLVTGVTLGAWDRLQAAQEAALGVAPGETFGERYEAALAAQRGLTRDMAAKAPVAHAAGEFVGGLAPGGAAGKAASAAGRIASSGLVGGVQGAMTAEDLGSADAAVRGAVGAGVGAAAQGLLGEALPAWLKKRGEDRALLEAGMTRKEVRKLQDAGQLDTRKEDIYRVLSERLGGDVKNAPREIEAARGQLAGFYNQADPSVPAWSRQDLADALNAATGKGSTLSPEAQESANVMRERASRLYGDLVERGGNMEQGAKYTMDQGGRFWGTNGNPPPAGLDPAVNRSWLGTLKERLYKNAVAADMGGPVSPEQYTKALDDYYALTTLNRWAKDRAAQKEVPGLLTWFSHNIGPEGAVGGAALGYMGLEHLADQSSAEGIHKSGITPWAIGAGAAGALSRNAKASLLASRLAGNQGVQTAAGSAFRGLVRMVTRQQAAEEFAAGGKGSGPNHSPFTPVHEE